MSNVKDEIDWVRYSTIFFLTVRSLQLVHRSFQAIRHLRARRISSGRASSVRPTFYIAYQHLY